MWKGKEKGKGRRKRAEGKGDWKRREEEGGGVVKKGKGRSEEGRRGDDSHEEKETWKSMENPIPRRGLRQDKRGKGRV